MIDIRTFSFYLAIVFLVIVLVLFIVSPVPVLFVILLLAIIVALIISFIYFLQNAKPSQFADVSGSFYPSILPPTLDSVAYYSFDSDKQKLTKLNLSKTIGNKQIKDYFHKNDESIFVLSDGSLVSIIGNSTRNIKSLPNVQKIRILNNQYVALSNGKIYSSNDLQKWTLDQSKPTSVLDIDVPSKQTNILHIRTPKQNIVYDTRQNKVISTAASEPIKLGSDISKVIKQGTNNVNIKDQLYNGYKFSDIDDKNTVYLVPEKIMGYNINNVLTADNQAIIGIVETGNLPDTIFTNNQLQTLQLK